MQQGVERSACAAAATRKLLPAHLPMLPLTRLGMALEKTRHQRTARCSLQTVQRAARHRLRTPTAYPMARILRGRASILCQCLTSPRRSAWPSTAATTCNSWRCRTRTAWQGQWLMLRQLLCCLGSWLGWHVAAPPSKPICPSCRPIASVLKLAMSRCVRRWRCWHQWTWPFTIVCQLGAPGRLRMLPCCRNLWQGAALGRGSFEDCKKSVRPWPSRRSCTCARLRVLPALMLRRRPRAASVSRCDHQLPL
mmetsp:Transcript_20041/g.60585  ORF Transcript_20041/g.60585 Transcript_20041/m.60585 type:complete len:251 (-) Transcript_20041:3391-4143(-)